ncbi:unnamed protein product [Ostreobium quekettii]|uniref:Uncharacterized protein n=1 Tax=Ostreobium quekettii TaxID=121088 RepID=A0A8S1JA59_9CHLO|nr:unnamed protein product [Ostreobium quekettii]|eukprot:evm.model.scf_637EXC.2 EVM.evm.TU.scf_637EXC.2   scf_637EXC:44361-48034(+)
MAVARCMAPPARVLLALMGLSAILSVSALKYAGSEHAYEWNEVHTARVLQDSSKGVCFEKGATTCVAYTLKANKPIMAFVALRSEAKASLQGANSSKYVEESVCEGTVCDIKVDVSERHSYCLVMLNRDNESPPFKASSSGAVVIEFKVNGCPATFWAIIAAVVVVVLLIALFACFGACCVHIVRNRNRQQTQALNTNPPVGPQVPGQVIASPPMYQQDVGAPPLQFPPQVVVGTPQPQPIQFLEAKL